MKKTRIKRKSPIRRKSKSERAILTDKLDEVCGQITKITFGHICQKCLKEVHGRNAHASHVYAKGVGASWRRFDLLNLKLLCYHCHRQWWHKEPMIAKPWFAKKFPVRAKYLDKKYGDQSAHPITTAEMRELLEERKEKLELLQSEMME